MAENKKSFVLYADLIHTVRKMPKEKAGELLLTILSYVNDENPIVEDMIVDLVFEPIKQQLKRDLINWTGFKLKQSDNGKLGGRPKKEKENENPKNPSLILETQKSLNVNVNVNDNVNDNVKKEKVKIKDSFNFDFVDLNFKKSFFHFLDYRKKIHKEFKTQMSLEACYKNLLELSKRDSSIAEQIVEQSIANQWQGLFELKEKNSAKKENGNQSNSESKFAGVVRSAENILRNRGIDPDKYYQKPPPT